MTDASGLLAGSLADTFGAMKAAEAARNIWWTEARERHVAGRATEACDDAASIHDDRAQSIRDHLKAEILSQFPGWTETMVREVFG